MRSSKVVELGYRRRQWPVALVKIWTKDVDDIYAAARSLIGPTFDFRDHHLNYAKLSIKLKKGRQGPRTDDHRDPARRQQVQHQNQAGKGPELCDRLLAKWHLVKEIGDVDEAPADAVAA